MKKLSITCVCFILLAVLLAGCGNQKEDYKNEVIKICNNTMNNLESFHEWYDTSYLNSTADATKNETDALIEKLDAARKAVEDTDVPSDIAAIHEEVLDWYDNCIRSVEDIYLLQSYSEVMDQTLQLYIDGRTIVSEEGKSATTNDAYASVFAQASAKYKEALVVLEKATPPYWDWLQEFHENFLDILDGSIAASDNIVVALQTNNTTLMSQSLNDLDTVAIASEHLLDTSNFKHGSSGFETMKYELPVIIDKLNAL